MSLHQILNQDSQEEVDNNKVILRDETIKPKKVVVAKKNDDTGTKSKNKTKGKAKSNSNETIIIFRKDKPIKLSMFKTIIF